MTVYEKLLVLAFLLFALTGSAQQFGGNAPSVKWKQLNVPAARVIYPLGLDSLASQVAGIVQQLNETDGSIGSRHRRVNFVLQKETTISNGYVGLGPFRSELYLTPSSNSFDLGSLPAHKLLAIHEFRHVQQYNNFNVGLSRAFRIIFGEDGQALANSLVIPDWFFEGDAVYNETRLSNQGRGRLPSFFNGYRSLWASGKNYSWMKLRNGSMKDYVPNHYQLGYLLVAYGREKYGMDIWKKVTADAAAFKGLTYPFQKAVKKYTGKNYALLRKEALDFYRSSDSALAQVSLSDRRSGHFIADEEFPAYINDSTLVTVSSSYKQLAAFVVHSGKQEKKLRFKDRSLENHFSYRNGRIVYASYRPHVRWGWKDYSEIQLLDVHNGEQRSITTGSKYFSPDINEDGSTIVAVLSEPERNSALHLLDAASGSVLKAIPNPDNYFYTHPRFYNNGQIVSAVRNKAGQMSVALIDAGKSTTEMLTPFSFNVIGFPFIQQDTIYFAASNGRFDRLFAVVMPGKRLYRLTHTLLERVTGNYQPAASAGKLAWSHFTSRGYRITEVDKAEIQWQPVPLELFAASTADFNVSSINSDAGDIRSSFKRIQSTAYAKSFRLLNFHSLRPFISDPDYSFSLVSENVLNTLQAEVSVNYNRNENFKQLAVNAIYGAWFPFVSTGVSYTLDRRGLFRRQRIYWNEWEYRSGLNLPLNLSKGKTITRMNTGADFVYNRPSFRGSFKDSLGNRSFGYINSYLTFSNQVQKARQHIYPRWAQSLLINYKKTVSGFDAHQFLVSGNFYLPGMRLTHNLVLNGAFQQKDTLNQYRFGNSFPFSRGYESENFHRMIKWGVNYHFPLCYPDAGFGNMVYFLRLRANLFFDYTAVLDVSRSRGNFRSGGTEIFFDTKWWNQLPLSFGFRYSYLLDDDLFGGSGPHRFDLILPVNLLQR
ncbi:MAG: hypothetical protein WKF97_24595 [Chitinophagaceae bacterium]